MLGARNVAGLNAVNILRTSHGTPKYFDGKTPLQGELKGREAKNTKRDIRGEGTVPRQKVLCK